MAIYRLGWYQGLGGRLVQQSGWVAASTQPDCPQDFSDGLITCRWPPTVSFDVGTDWTSGLYVAVLTSAAGYKSAVPFTVRSDARRSTFLYVQPVTTYQAYNQWPGDGTGRNLYDGGVTVSF